MARDSILEVAQDLQRLEALRDPIAKAARKYNQSPAVIAAICSRETRAKHEYCVPPTQGGKLGDHGHGCGPMQIDDRSFPEWCAAWKAGRLDVNEAVRMGCEVLMRKSSYIHSSYNSLSGEPLLKAAIAAYNRGEGNVVKSLIAHRDVDIGTAGNDYSKDVLARAEYLTRHGWGGIWTTG